MKKIIIYSIFFILSSNISFSQNVAINNTGNTPNPNAILDIDVSTNDMGILIPRLTSAERTAMSLAAADEGLTVYDETTNSYWYWNGTSWINMDAYWKLTGNTGTDASINFIGTTDKQYFKIKTNNTLRLIVDNNSNNIGIGSDFSGGYPQNNIEIREQFGSLRISSFTDAAWWDGSELLLQRSRGSINSPLTLQSGDYLGKIVFMGGNNSNVSGTEAAGIKSVSGTDWNTTKSADLRFYTSNGPSTAPERMIIENEGRVGIAIDNPDPFSRFQVEGGIGVGVGNGISSTHGDHNSIQFNTDTYYGGVNDEHSGALLYAANMDGWTTARFDVCISTNWGTYNTSNPGLAVTQGGIFASGTYYTSDKRLKTDIENTNYGLSTIMQMQPVSYLKYNSSEFDNGQVLRKGNGTQNIGFIAQDLYNIVPEIVSKPKDETKEFWAIDYAKISVITVKAIQEQQKQIETQQQIIEQLQNSILEMQEEIDNLKK